MDYHFLLFVCTFMHFCHGAEISIYPIGSDYLREPEISNGTVRIIHGEVAGEGEVAYQVLLRGLTPQSQFLCGGSLISPKHVLTAAHCVAGTLVVYVTLGNRKLTHTREDGITTMTVHTSDIIIHEDYDPFNIRNDIAVIRLPRKLEFTNNVQAIRIPKLGVNSAMFQNKVGVITGWGKTSDDSENASDDLMKADVHIMDPFLCTLHYSRMKYMIDNRQLCTASQGSASCSGDSGGPLAVKEPDGILTVVGIVSFGSRSCQGSPSVFTSVAAYVPWLHRVAPITRRK